MSSETISNRDHVTKKQPSCLSSLGFVLSVPFFFASLFYMYDSVTNMLIDNAIANKEVNEIIMSQDGLTFLIAFIVFAVCSSIVNEFNKANKDK